MRKSWLHSNRKTDAESIVRSDGTGHAGRRQGFFFRVSERGRNFKFRLRQTGVEQSRRGQADPTVPYRIPIRQSVLPRMAEARGERLAGGDGRSPLRPANAERPASIQHSAFSIARATRGPWRAPGSHSAFSTQHSAFGIAAPTRSSSVRSRRSRRVRRRIAPRHFHGCPSSHHAASIRSINRCVHATASSTVGRTGTFADCSV